MTTAPTVFCYIAKDRCLCHPSTAAVELNDFIMGKDASYLVTRLGWKEIVARTNGPVE